MTITQRIMRALRIVSISLVVLLAVGWFVASPLVWPELYRSELFHPELNHGDVQALRAFKEFDNHELFFSARDGSKMHGWFFHNPKSDKVFLFHQGNSGDIPKRLPALKLLLEAGGSVFIYEPRGFGISPGRPTPESICEDGVTAYDFLASKLGYRPKQIVIYGESLGAAVATYVSERRESCAMILQSGFSSLEAVGKEKVPIVRVYPWFMFPRPQLDNVAILRHPHPPLLILHGEKDTLIPIAHSERMYREAAAPKQMVRFKHSGHSEVLPEDVSLYHRVVSEFVLRLP